MFKYIGSIALVLCLYTVSSAQVSLDVPEQINEEVRMKNASIDSTRIPGYRIQIAFSNNMNTVKTARSKFVQTFPECSAEAYLLYQQPYWKLRVGDYYREIDAQKDLAKIREKFPKAFVVKDHIQRPPL